MFYLRFIVVALCCLNGVAVAQETPATEESATDDNPYLSLLRSKDRATQLTAERYLNLVKRQEWTDLSGRFKTMGKYVAHDPNLMWVRLEVSRGSGKDRVVKEVQVPVAKLSKACQFRVRQIARLQPKLDELIAAEAEADDDELADGASMNDERGDERQFEAYGAELSDDPRAMEQGREQPVDLSEEAPPVGSGDWRTSYDAFRQNISVGMDASGQPRVEWGGLSELRTLSEALATPTSEGPYGTDAAGRQRIIAEATAQLGEVTWEAPFLGVSPGLLGVRANFQVMPPSPPATIQFLVADKPNLERWAQLQPGQSVRFTGRLGLLTPNAIVVWVKMTDEQAAALGPVEAEREIPPQFRRP